MIETQFVKLGTNFSLERKIKRLFKLIVHKKLRQNKMTLGNAKWLRIHNNENLWTGCKMDDMENGAWLSKQIKSNNERKQNGTKNNWTTANAHKIRVEFSNWSNINWNLSTSEMWNIYWIPFVYLRRKLLKFQQI